MLTPSTPLPSGAALRHWIISAMDVILHLGAHRTGTTTFQDYMRRHKEPLAAQKVAFWGPRKSRYGFSVLGLNANACHSDGRKRVETLICRLLDRKSSEGVSTLVVSDENIIGSIGDNLRSGSLYDSVADRAAQIAKTFDGRVTELLFSPRSLEVYWCSALAQGVSQKTEVPCRDKLQSIANASRSWRDVITDLAQAVPTAALRVLPFEAYVGRPDAFLAKGAGVNAPQNTKRMCLLPSPTLPELRRFLNDRGTSACALPFGMGRWNPFSNEEHGILREKHADDMMWLASGADGLATLTEDCLRDRAGPTPPPGGQTKGLRDELEERHMAGPGRR